MAVYCWCCVETFCLAFGVMNPSVYWNPRSRRFWICGCGLIAFGIVNNPTDPAHL